jgi:transposase InsO family protein
VQAVELLESALKSGCAIEKACTTVGISVRTYERWRKDPSGDKRKGPRKIPANKFTETERQQILKTANCSEFRDKSPCQIVPLLADKGLYLASEASFYRILKQEGLNTHRSRSKPISRTRPEEIVATSPNQVWSWDITYLKSNINGIFYYLYLVMDIYSRKIVGYEVHENQTSENAAEMIEKICKREGVRREQITLHSDNGKPMKGATMLATLQRLGVIPSFSRPSVSDDNPYSESLFKTLKYCPRYPSKPFESTKNASSWVEAFVAWYNEEHLHSGIRFVTPASRHRGEDTSQLMKRKHVYTNAKLRMSIRWSGPTRNWDYIEEVNLNCLKGKDRSCNKKIA